MSNINLIFESWRRHLSEQEDKEDFAKIVQYFKASIKTDMISATHAVEMAKSIGGETNKKFHKFLLKEKNKARAEILNYIKYYKYDSGMLTSAGPVGDKFNEINDYASFIDRALSAYKT